MERGRGGADPLSSFNSLTISLVLLSTSTRVCTLSCTLTSHCPFAPRPYSRPMTFIKLARPLAIATSRQPI